MKAGKTEKAISQISKAMHTVTPVLEAFDTASKVNIHRTHNQAKEFTCDLHRIVKDLQKNKVLNYIPKRHFPTFPKPKYLLSSTPDTLMSWIEGLKPDF